MESYNSPYCDAVLVDFGDETAGAYHSIKENKEDARVMSPAAYDVVDKMIERWLTRPGAVCCKLSSELNCLQIFLEDPDHSDHIADFTVDVRDIFLSYAQTSREFYGHSSAAMSEMLRKLADDVDAVEEYHNWVLSQADPRKH